MKKGFINLSRLKVQAIACTEKALPFLTQSLLLGSRQSYMVYYCGYYIMSEMIFMATNLEVGGLVLARRVAPYLLKGECNCRFV
ncbi:hypothetical protein X474_24875 [Dethiosulfatarculus sandiegensis]|uniref:Uncharacterized protein n=1 Tax=Dethiosulfatarculus sandiegensis TaxID=1429043 RepID=A0A0D2J041_9BACT|nr:hypothetical protein X474_24875 [Dethiosulfatarculus sandiegensis]